MAVGDGSTLLVYKDMGLVSHVFDERTLATLQGHLAIGHTRYSTTGGSRWENAQPTFKTTASGGGLALAHNGNLTNTAELASGLERHGTATTDSDLVAELLAAETGLSLEDAIARTLPRLQGAYSLMVMDEHTVFGARRPARSSATSSPGSTSRTNQAPTMSSAAVSEAITQPPPGSWPMQRGRKPCGSRAPNTVCSSMTISE